MECSAEGGCERFGDTAIVLFIVGHSCGGCKSWHCEVPQDMSIVAPANKKNRLSSCSVTGNLWPDGWESRESRGESRVTKTMSPDWV